MSVEGAHSNGSASAEVAARVERRWATIAVIIVVMMALLAAFAGIHRATMPQPRVETTDPSRLHLSGEFVESNLGSVLEANGNVTVRAIGQQYSFTPACSPTTRSPPSFPTSAPPGAIAARRSRRARPTSCAPHR